MKRKCSSGDHRFTHGYIIEATNKGISNEGWKTSKIKRGKRVNGIDGPIISIKIIEKVV